MERKIGEIFEYNGEWYQCIPDTTDDNCNNCFFQKSCSNITGDCSSTARSDGKSVAFKKLEKVGSPFSCNYYGDARLSMMQEYQLFDGDVTYCYSMPQMFVTDIKHKRIAIEIKQTKEDMEENKLNLKPFDIQKAREGKPVCTRDGRKVRIICFDAKMKRNIIALIQDYEFKDEEIAVEYFPNGCFYDNDFDTSLDLMMPPEKKEGWINVYKMKESTFGYITAYFDTEEKAKEDKEQLTGYVATVKIEWTE